MRPGLKELMRAYNLAKKASKSNRLIETGRLNRALGILMSRNSEEKLCKHHSDIISCQCADNIYRHDVICKHRLARMLQAREIALPAPDIDDYTRTLKAGRGEVSVSEFKKMLEEKDENSLEI